jgi:hypothetical protein
LFYLHRRNGEIILLNILSGASPYNNQWLAGLNWLRFQFVKKKATITNASMTPAIPTPST